MYELELDKSNNWVMFQFFYLFFLLTAWQALIKVFGFHSPQKTVSLAEFINSM